MAWLGDKLHTSPACTKPQKTTVAAICKHFDYSPGSGSGGEYQEIYYVYIQVNKNSIFLSTILSPKL